ncbi:MAG: Vms1/Ankzf1 family peptidyl-tRNA hydrolase [Actinomycetota bacterium]|nr:Vms1/Ankzf1 family peptidyl-tRNA hydrolase [Actinomycetota bacterium]
MTVPNATISADLRDEPVLDALDTIDAGRPPFVSIYLRARSDVEDAEERFDIRWRNARRHIDSVLREAGVDPSDDYLDRVGDALGSHADGATAVVLADADGPRAVGELSEPVRHDVVEVHSLARVVPRLAWERSQVPHVVVVADREGADIVTVEPLAEPIVRSVDGDTEHIHRDNTGGLEHKRHQTRAENTWDRNARAVADEVAEAARRIDAGLIVVAGDVRALQFLREHLPQEVTSLVREATASAEHGDDELADEIVRWEATIAAERTVATLHAFAEALGRDEAVEGAEATFAALRQRRVATLLIADDSERTEPGDDAWFDPGDRALVADEASELDGVAQQTPVSGPRSEVALRAGLASGADVQLVPAVGRHVPSEGIGAILRF